MEVSESFNIEGYFSQLQGRSQQKMDFLCFEGKGGSPANGKNYNHLFHQRIH
jgi:hypothetical protein